VKRNEGLACVAFVVALAAACSHGGEGQTTSTPPATGDKTSRLRPLRSESKSNFQSTHGRITNARDKPLDSDPGIEPWIDSCAVAIRTATQLVWGRVPSDEPITPPSARHDVRTAATLQHVRSAAARKYIRRAPTLESVTASAAQELIESCIALKAVPASSTSENVVAVTTKQPPQDAAAVAQSIVPGSTVQVVLALAGNERVVSISGD
jgi:hypothetical protein